ncbi:MAG: hypothetical protein JNK15_07520 [Planctomycetes bacterium]|nr:hypothetical protein [Planctomycetota bacterium]
MRSRFVALSLFAALAAGCKSTSMDVTTSPQAVVEAVAKENPDCTRLTVHCKKGDAAAAICASTDKARIGQASHAEDLKVLGGSAMEVLEENGGFDVTLPITCKVENCKCAVGVTMKAGIAKEAAIAKAQAIAKAVESRLGACEDGKCASGCCDGAAGGACCAEKK